MKNFTQFYELFANESSYSKYVRSDNKLCRFCGRNHNQISFNSIPHILPELFGKNSFTWNEECDGCNKKFQLWESHAATFIQPYLALIGTKTKNKIPQFQSRKAKGEYSTKLINEKGKKHLEVGKNLGDFKYVGSNEADLVLRTKSFNPFKIYKLFLKIGISLLPKDNIELIDNYLDCLTEKMPFKNGFQHYTVYRQLMLHKMHTVPQVQLYKAKRILVNGMLLPEFILVVGTSNLFFQIFLPLSINNTNVLHKAKKWHLELFPAFKYDNWKKLGQLKIEKCDLSVNRNVTMDEKIRLSFSEVEKNINRMK